MDFLLVPNPKKVSNFVYFQSLTIILKKALANYLLNFDFSRSLVGELIALSVGVLRTI